MNSSCYEWWCMAYFHFQSCTRTATVWSTNRYVIVTVVRESTRSSITITFSNLERFELTKPVVTHGLAPKLAAPVWSLVIPGLEWVLQRQFVLPGRRSAANVRVCVPSTSVLHITCDWTRALTSGGGSLIYTCRVYLLISSAYLWRFKDVHNLYIPGFTSV